MTQTVAQSGGSTLPNRGEPRDRLAVVVEPASVDPGALPYGPVMTRALRPLQRGFLVLNRWLMAPLLRAGLGWLVGNPATGYVMLLRTRGHRTGLPREAPLGYVISDGAVYCVAGYGRPTPWYRNLLADPEVQVVLPTRCFPGHAEPVTDRDDWLAAYRALIGSFGIVGRLVIGDVSRLDDAALAQGHRALPVVRIRPEPGERPLVAGLFDPGGAGWLLPYGALGLGLGVVLARRGSGRRPRTPRQSRPERTTSPPT